MNTQPGMRRRRGGGGLWFAGLATVAAFCLWVAAVWPLEVLAHRLLGPAQIISEGGQINAIDLNSARNEFQANHSQLRCRADLLRAGGTLWLETRWAQSPAEIKDSLLQAQSLFAESLACAPYQGNMWLVLAQIHAQIAGFDHGTLELLERSHRLAPREAWIQSRRVAFEVNAEMILPAPATLRLESGIREIIAGPDWRSLVEIYRSSTATGRQRILKAIESSPDDAKSRFFFHIIRGL